MVVTLEGNFLAQLHFVLSPPRIKPTGLAPHLSGCFLHFCGSFYQKLSPPLQGPASLKDVYSRRGINIELLVYLALYIYIYTCIF